MSEGSELDLKETDEEGNIRKSLLKDSNYDKQSFQSRLNTRLIEIVTEWLWTIFDGKANWKF